MPTASDLATTALAHQGGWDEMVLVAVPMVVLAGLLWLARRRAEREAEDEAMTPTEASEAGPE
ncbi:MAG: hypothetical protein KY438_06935 [Actinobacteria bacterium]|nr:hypothetical protein [Actinomycetota bacterium]